MVEKISHDDDGTVGVCVGVCGFVHIIFVSVSLSEAMN